MIFGRPAVPGQHPLRNPIGIQRLPPLPRRIARRLLRHIRPIAEVGFDEFRLAIDLRDRYIASELIMLGTWESHLQRLLPHVSLDGKVAIDVGANVGVYTCLLSRFVGGSGTVIALEPEDQNFRLLERNVRMNGIRNAVLIHAAAGDREENVVLSIDRVNQGNHLVDNTAAGARTTQECRMIPLDMAIAPDLARSISYVKIDVQGAELRVLRGMKQLVEENPDLILQLEMASALPAAEETWDLLRSWGFDGFEISRSASRRARPPRERDEDQTDLVLARNIGVLESALRMSGSLF